MLWSIIAVQSIVIIWLWLRCCGLGRVCVTYEEACKKLNECIAEHKKQEAILDETANTWEKSAKMWEQNSNGWREAYYELVELIENARPENYACTETKGQ